MILGKLKLEHIPRLAVFNKVDRLENSGAFAGRSDAVAVSALKGEGLDALVKLIGARVVTESRTEAHRAL